MVSDRRSVAWLGVLLVVAALTGVLSGQMRPFDYYVFSLSWAPEYCQQSGAAAANPLECATGRNIGFIVHGLWPEVSEGKSPEACGPATSVSRGIVNSMLPSMLSAGLIQHEWATHGTCTGMPVSAYFTTVLLARAAVQIPVQLSSLGETANESPEQIAEQFAAANPAFPRGAFRVACRNGALTEVRACFDKSLKPQACTARVAECPSASITIRPPR